MSHFNRPAVHRQHCIAKQAEQINSCRFFNLLTDSQLLDVVESHLPEHRERLYPPTETLSLFLGQVMSADGSCQNVVNEANVSRAFTGLSLRSSSTGGYCIARKRLPLEMIRKLSQETGRLLEIHSPVDWLWKGRSVKLVDGTTVSLADSQDNQAHYPQHGNQAEGAGFPLARLVGVISLATGGVLTAAIGPYRGKGTGEHGLFRQLREVFASGDLMLADSYYCSYFLIADMQGRGAEVLFEQHGARQTDFRRGKKLGERDHLVNWSKPSRPAWMSPEEYKEYPDKLEVREMRVRGKVLVTTLLNPGETSKNELGKLFVLRWSVELDLRNIKTTLGMEALKCKTAAMCEKEMWVYFLAYNLIRLLMAEAASQAGIPPRQLSFKHTLQIWVAWSQRQYLSNGEEDTEVLFILIAQKRVGMRPDRVEPRAVKRRPKPFIRLKISRQAAREQIIKNGHGKKLGLN
jgi:hypothetical protein